MAPRDVPAEDAEPGVPAGEVTEDGAEPGIVVASGPARDADPRFARAVGHLVGLVDGREGRVVVGLVGPPGAGKSTVASALVAALRARGVASAVVPMDGFHLADVTLDRLGLRDRKGAPETFDADGYVALLRRLRSETDRPVFAPGFERTLEQPIAAAVMVPAATRVVVTEGNYLLLDAEPWRAVRTLLDETWYVACDPQVRRAGLRERHVAFGKSASAARAWEAGVDEANARLVEASRCRATREIDVTGWRVPPAPGEDRT